MTISRLEDTQTGTNTPGQNERKNYDNEGILHIRQSWGTGASPSDTY